MVLASVVMAPTLAQAPRALSAPAVSRIPDDRYVMAGGCFAVRSLQDNRFVHRTNDGFDLSAQNRSGAEPFRFQATALGRYLLYGTARDFLAAEEGLAGQAADAFSGSIPGRDAEGASLGASRDAADGVADGPLGTATGRGGSVVAAPGASELADWTITRAGRMAFRLRLEATGQELGGGEESDLVLTEVGAGDSFRFEPATGCAQFPEAQVNVTGPVLRGQSPFQQVRGYLEGHSHPMAFEFLGGRVRCGRPWHPYGIAHALVDCADHEPGGRGGILEAAVSGTDPVAGHDTVGWPTFGYWPKYNSYTHEQVYYKWLERAWRGGLRLYVSLLVDNGALCDVYPLKVNSCNEMDGVRLQNRRIHELQNYIDAQSGGPGKGWFRIVTDPFQARRVINQGKLAVIKGIEVSSPLDCKLVNDQPQCDEADIDRELGRVWKMGVRQMELTNKFDNALTGVTGDSGNTGYVVNVGNFEQTGRWWEFETCDPSEEHSHDKPQPNVGDDAGVPGTERDAIFGAVLQASGTSGITPVYPPTPHCNVRDLTGLGRHAIRRMMAKGMIFDPDHMSARARRQAMDLVGKAKYSGVISSHSWADDGIYERIVHLGGVVTPHAGRSESFAEEWENQRRWAESRFLFGIGYGADTNGFSAQGAPRGADVKNPVRYPFRGLGGTLIHRQVSGQRTYDVNVDGVAHYGLYPDWIEDLRMLKGDAIVRDLERGAEAYLQMWERAVGIPVNACRTDAKRLSDQRLAKVRPGMSALSVMRTLGQPQTRPAGAYTFCASGGRRATVELTSRGTVKTVRVS
ncbi:MAG: hypothetical protein LC722_04530 [Actinobacteria bacterium]|nr:hypothetical protein [Actinomycetota bacterium]